MGILVLPELLIASSLGVEPIRGKLSTLQGLYDQYEGRLPTTYKLGDIAVLDKTVRK